MLRYKAGSLNGFLHLPRIRSFKRGTKVDSGRGSRAAARTNVAVETRRTEQIVVGAW